MQGSGVAPPLSLSASLGDRQSLRSLSVHSELPRVTGSLWLGPRGDRVWDNRETLETLPPAPQRQEGGRTVCVPTGEGRRRRRWGRTPCGRAARSRPATPGFPPSAEFPLFSCNNGVVRTPCRELDSSRSSLSAASAFAIATAGANEGTPNKEKYRRMSLASAGARGARLTASRRSAGLRERRDPGSLILRSLGRCPLWPGGPFLPVPGGNPLPMEPWSPPPPTCTHRSQSGGPRGRRSGGRPRSDSGDKRSAVQGGGVHAALQGARCERQPSPPGLGFEWRWVEPCSLSS